MSKKDTEKTETKIARRAEALEECCDHSLAGMVAYAGGTLTGFSIKIGRVDTLLTVRALFPAGHMIAWVGGESIVEVLLKSVRLASADSLRWKADKYRVDGG